LKENIMPDYAATLLAALIGAIIGSIGAVFIEFWLSGRAKDKQSRKLIAQKYLFQLQDATESLWYRIDNLVVFHGEIKDDSYFEFTTLYTLGRVLASERILVFDGVYPLLNELYPELTNTFRNRIDKTLGKIGLKQYDRIALAESLIESENGRFRLSTYLEFRRKFEAEGHKEQIWLEPSRKAIRSLSEENVRKIISEIMYEVAKEISKNINVTSSLSDLEIKRYND
jgi:hypothetical protein